MAKKIILIASQGAALLARHNLSEDQVILINSDSPDFDEQLKNNGVCLQYQYPEPKVAAEIVLNTMQLNAAKAFVEPRRYKPLVNDPHPQIPKNLKKRYVQRRIHRK